MYVLGRRIRAVFSPLDRWHINPESSTYLRTSSDGRDSIIAYAPRASNKRDALSVFARQFWAEKRPIVGGEGEGRRGGVRM